MEGVLAILLIFGMPVFIVFIQKYFRYREKLLEAQKADARQLGAADEERAKLEARIQNLETIVCSVDFELNQRLNRLAMEQQSLQMQALPAQAEARAPSVLASAGTAAAGGTAGAIPTGGTLARGMTRAMLVHGPGRLEIGQTLAGRYRVERELGHGGMGAVYLASDSKLGERVALKTILSTLAGDPTELTDRFRREVQAARKVTHPNVIRIHDLGEEGPLLFLSMEFIDGETLHARVKRLGPLPVPEAVEILQAVADGVAAAHQAGIVHRDLKPQNVLLGAGSGGRSVKVIDFGLAQTSFASGLTATGIIMGTPEYMAPEQIRGGRCDARTDVYALGAMAYHVLCGQPPFAGSTPIAIGFAQVNEAPKPLRALRPEIPARLEQAVLKALAKDPADRYLDATEWREALG